MISIDARFRYKGGEFVKLALSLAQDKERTGNVQIRLLTSAATVFPCQRLNGF